MAVATGSKCLDLVIAPEIPINKAFCSRFVAIQIGSMNKQMIQQEETITWLVLELSNVSLNFCLFFF